MNTQDEVIGLENAVDDSVVSSAASKVTLKDVRTLISPYLPPPVVDGMTYIDSNPSMESLGDEPSMLILSAILTIFLIGKVFKLLSFLSSGKAIEGLDNDGESPEGNVLDNLGGQNKKNGAKNEQGIEYDDSVILFGPSYVGKSTLFHTLLTHNNDDDNNESKERKLPHTVMSLKANVSYLKGDGYDQTKNVRIVDYPGHITLSSHLPSLLHPPPKGDKKVRALLVVDSTKVVSEAASLLYNTVLTNNTLLTQWERQNAILHVLVVCNKTDATNSKNWRRIKIQLRSELEKLKKISSGVSSSNGTGLEGDGKNKRPLSGKSIDMDDLTKNGLTNIKVSFSSFSCVTGEGIDAINAFVTQGQIMTDNSSILAKRKQDKQKI